MEIPIEMLKIEDTLRNGCHILCRVHINNKEFRMLIDTGASLTVFDISKADSISSNILIDNDQTVRTIGNDGIDSKYLIINEMRIGNINIVNYKTIMVDLKQFNLLYKQQGLPFIDGIIGGDILIKYNAIIDYNKKVMILI